LPRSQFLYRKTIIGSFWPCTHNCARQNIDENEGRVGGSEEVYEEKNKKRLMMRMRMKRRRRRRKGDGVRRRGRTGKEKGKAEEDEERRIRQE
jgi:hypothetical protein